MAKLKKTKLNFLDNELGGIRKPFGSVPFSVGMVYPNDYSVGMSSLGYQIIHSILNKRSDSLSHRIFMDSPDGKSIEAEQPAWRYPALGFSLSYEVDYINVARFIKQCDIPLRHTDRSDDMPILIAGGPAVALNPHPLAAIFDLLIFGEGEETIGHLAEAYVESDGRHDAFFNLAEQIMGVVVPPLMDWQNTYPINSIPAQSDLKSNYPFSFDIVTPDAEFSDMCVVELSRGCPYRCTFCTEGYKPVNYRPRPLDKIKEEIDGKRSMTNKFGFLASAVGSHPDIRSLCSWAFDEGLQVSYSSLRVEDVKDEMLDLLIASGQRTLTIAPETGNYEMRKKLLKRMPDEKIFAFTDKAISRGMQNIKLYFMIGVPGETDDDVRDIAALVEKLHEVQVGAARQHGRIGRLVLNIGIYVPKPGTPLARGGFTHPEILRERQKLLKRELSEIPNVTARWQPFEEAITEAIMANCRQDGIEFIEETAGRRRPPSSLLNRWLEKTVPVRKSFNLSYEDVLAAVKEMSPRR